MGKALLKKAPSIGNIKPPNYDGIVSGDMARWDVLEWNHDVNKLVKIRDLKAELFRIDSRMPVPWYNLNPISQGSHGMSNRQQQKTSMNDREGSNRL